MALILTPVTGAAAADGGHGDLAGDAHAAGPRRSRYRLARLALAHADPGSGTARHLPVRIRVTEDGRCTARSSVPTHPYKGGVAQHTTTLAHRLAAAGDDVDLVSWSAQYPAALYPGVQRVTTPEIPVFPGTRYPLAWYRPDSWWRLGRLPPVPAGRPAVAGSGHSRADPRLSRDDRCPRPAAAARPAAGHRGDLPQRAAARAPPRATERSPEALLARCDVVLTHTDEEAARARELGAADVRTAELPPHGPGTAVTTPQGEQPRTRRTAGAAACCSSASSAPTRAWTCCCAPWPQVPDARLVVAGEVWDGEDRIRALVDELGLGDRVDLRLAYLPNDELDALLRDADALVLPYTSGTGTQQVRVAQAHGVPVIASRISSMPEQVARRGRRAPGRARGRRGPGRARSAGSTSRDGWRSLRSAVRPPDDDLIWQRYVDTLTGAPPQPG